MTLAGLTGRGVRVAIVDSGVNPGHPHVGGIAGGVEITANGEKPVYLDYVGHGTAVAAAIHEKAPEALLYAVKVFDRMLSTRIDRLLRAIEWCVDNNINVVNLSVGTINPAHRARLQEVVVLAAASGLVLVAAQDLGGQPSLQGSLSGVIPVAVDWGCPRDSYRVGFPDARACFLASGYPRPIPGVSPDRNLNGTSFAIANMTGFVVRAREIAPQASCSELEQLLVACASKDDGQVGPEPPISKSVGQP